MKLILFLLINFLFSFQCLYLLKPSKDFNESLELISPDYSKETYWSALPWRKNTAEEVPKESDLKDNQENAPVDVFFIHPTTYLRGKTWNGNLEDSSLNKRTDDGTIKHQASVFNKCCKVYAPRYRQAVIHVFLKETEDGEKALNLAYEDVKKSFLHYMENWNKGRPFILASHSQGTHHSIRLLNEVIANTTYQKQFIAGYLIGMPYSEKDSKIKACESEKETGCIINWNTFLENSRSSRLIEKYESSLCINPLSWEKNELKVDKKFNSGSLNKNFDKLYKGAVSAKCDSGHLWINKPEIGKMITFQRGENYHVMDYALFYNNIRDNAVLRTNEFLKKN
ncbi:MAG: DUF3089 domain-containing protein [Leptospiraceae bacterium]|nr:DUF3089 domain-containing protein [Leptospiraceae bacterium]